MQVPVEIAFRHYEASEDLIRDRDASAPPRKVQPRITSCHVVVAGPQTRHRSGDLFKVELRIAMPEHKEVVVDKTHGDKPEREHALVAIREVFDAAIRQIEGAEQDMRGQVKEHVADKHGRVTKFLAGEDCGFHRSGGRR